MKTKKPQKKIRVVLPPPDYGTLDPELVRKAIIELRDARLRRQSKARLVAHAS